MNRIASQIGVWPLSLQRFRWVRSRDTTPSAKLSTKCGFCVPSTETILLHLLYRSVSAESNLDARICQPASCLRCRRFMLLFRFWHKTGCKVCRIGFLLGWKYASSAYLLADLSTAFSLQDRTRWPRSPVYPCVRQNRYSVRRLRRLHHQYAA